MTRPLIGISCYAETADYWIMRDDDVVLLPRTYVDMVLAAGGVPVLLAPVTGAADAVDVLDGLIVAGGPDVDPARYGRPAGPHTDPPRTERDAADLAALRRAHDRTIPVLGICRGHQLLNVARGGTLHQHLPDVVGVAAAAVHAAGPGVYAPVDVVAEPGSRVAAALGTAPVRVRCHHHQAVDRVGDGLRVTARHLPASAATDLAGITEMIGIVEAVESAPGTPWTVGVQWHPERDGADLRLARALVEAAAQARPSRRTA